MKDDLEKISNRGHAVKFLLQEPVKNSTMVGAEAGELSPEEVAESIKVLEEILSRLSSGRKCYGVSIHVLTQHQDDPGSIAQQTFLYGDPFFAVSQGLVHHTNLMAAFDVVADWLNENTTAEEATNGNTKTTH